MKTIPMHYRIPVEGLREDLRPLYPMGTDTAQLIRDGHRSGTTRRPFAKAGELFKIHGCPGVYRVTGVWPVDLVTDEGRATWSAREGWDVDFCLSRHGRQVWNDNARQTTFEKVQE